MLLKKSWVNRNGNATYFIAFSMIMFALLEVLNGVLFYTGFNWILSPSTLPKLVWQIVLFVLVFKKLHSLSQLEKLFIIFSLTSITVLGLNYFLNADNSLWAVKHLDKLFLCFYVYIFLCHYDIKLARLLQVLDWIFIANSVIILIGLMFNIEFFKSYPFSERFGFSGIFARVSINDVSLFYLIGNFYLFYRWKHHEINVLYFIIVFGASFFVGTKAIYLQNVILLVFIAVSLKEYRKQILIFGGLIITVVILSYNFSFWYELYKEKGILSALTSLRSDLFIERIPKAIEEMGIVNIFFGMVNPFPYFVEMDIVDLFLTLGLVGFILYIYFYYKILFQFSSKNYFAWMFVAAYFILVSVSGRYLYSGVNVIYFPLFLYYLKLNQSIELSILKNRP